MTTTVECRRCGHVFQTGAVTKTRCRSCGAVATIGRPARTLRTGSPEKAPASSSALGIPVDSAPDMLGLGLAVVGVFCLWRGFTLRGAMAEHPEKGRRARNRWYVAGFVLTAAGVVIVIADYRKKAGTHPLKRPSLSLRRAAADASASGQQPPET